MTHSRHFHRLATGRFQGISLRDSCGAQRPISPFHTYECSVSVDLQNFGALFPCEPNENLLAISSFVTPLPEWMM